MQQAGAQDKRYHHDYKKAIQNINDILIDDEKFQEFTSNIFLALDEDETGVLDIALVEKLAAQLTDEKDIAENKWLKLRQDLGITSLDDKGNVSNPYNKRLFYLEDQQAKLKSELLDVQERAQQLANSLREDPETKLIDPVMVKVAALVAQDYLNLSSSDYNGSTKNKQYSSELAKKSTLENRSWQLETKLMDLKFILRI